MTHLTRRHALLGMTALTLTAPALAACGGGARPDGGEAGGGAGGGLTAWALTGNKESMWQSEFDEWNSDNPDNTFDVEYMANDAYKERIRTAVGAGNAPTLIFGWGGGTLADYVDNDAVVELTGQVEELNAQVIESVAAGGEVEGSVYAVATGDTQPVVLYYNTEMFDEHGVTPPTTWDELTEAISTFQDEGITPIALAGSSVWPELMYIQYLTDRIGGEDVFQRVQDNEPDAWSDPAIESALEHIIELVDSGAFGDGFTSVVADGGADAALVHTGRAAMILQGSWVYNTFKEDAPEFVEDGKLGYLNFPDIPDGDGDPANIVGNTANYWSVSSAASEEEQQQAIQFLNEYNLSDQSIEVLIADGAIPAVVDMESRLEESEDSGFLLHAYGMVQDAPHFQLSWDQALAPAPAQELLTNLSQIFLRQIEPQEFIDNMNATISS
ncbi:MAG: extracellular solute-binding protein [Brachybacterium sp.]|nr:extracellular solute-binding protein [Brachybacterium sp.]